MNHSAQLDNLITALVNHLIHPARLIELTVLLGALFAVWLAIRRLRRHLSAAPGMPATLTRADWSRVLLPAALLPLMLIARAVLARWQDVHLLNLAVPLLVSFLVIQACFFLLRYVLKPSHALQTVERTVSWLVWGALALHLTGYLGEVVATLDGFGFAIGKQRISLYTVLMGLISLAATLMLALWLARLVENRLINVMPVNANLRLALSKLARSLFVVLAVLVALPLVGIDITVLSVFGGALGVGLGLGLQKVASNYVSGFTLLLDQSIRIGDMVTVGGLYGEVTRIATRYTVVRALDGSEAILPNESLVTSTVINHSLSNPDNQVSIPVQVAYKSNLKKAEAIMLEAARQHPRVIPEHPPLVRLASFGDNGINLSLVVWIADPEESQIALISDLNWAIWEGFQREGIEIPYPQRVVRTA